VAEQLYSSKVEQGDVSGRIYIGKPDIARKDRKLQYIFINKRHISNRLLQKAINDGFKGFIHRDLQPVYFLFLELPPAAVDVNVHPRKQEVKFQQPQAIYSAVLGLVRHLLTTSTKQDMLDRFSSSSENGARELPNWNLKDRGINRETYAIKGSSNISQVTKPIAQSALDFSRELLAGQSEQTSKPGDAYEYYSSGSRYTQLFGTYIVYQQADEVLFVDQHAAAEKILYEKLSTQPAAATSNPLLVPEILELEQQDKKAILEARDELSRLGIKLADFGGNSVQVTSKPSLAPNLDVASFWQEVRSESIDLEQVKNLSNPGEVDLALATMACHGSIRAGQPLSQPEMGQLISDLLKCNTPYNCPHGRPVSWSMSRTELEKHFKRIL
jgi:DNA mismatch repair protein MutL